MPAVDLAASYPGKVYAYFYDHMNDASRLNQNKQNNPSLYNCTYR